MNEHNMQILERWVHCSGYDCSRKSCIEQLVSTHHAINNKVRTLCAHHYTHRCTCMHVCGSIELLFMSCPYTSKELQALRAPIYARKSLPVRAPMLAGRCSCDSSHVRARLSCSCMIYFMDFAFDLPLGLGGADLAFLLGGSSLTGSGDRLSTTSSSSSPTALLFTIIGSSRLRSKSSILT